MTTSEIDCRIHDLLNELAKQETEARALREEVKNLESVTAILGEEEGELNVVKQDKKELRAQGAARVAAYRRYDMPEEFVEGMTRALDRLKASRVDYVKIALDKQKSMEHLARTHKQEDERHAYLEKLYGKARWRPGAKHRFTSVSNVDDNLLYLRKQLSLLLEKREALEKQMEVQKKGMQDALQRLEKLKNLDEEKYKANTDLKLKDSEYQAVCDEIGSYRRILARKRKLLKSASDMNATKKKIRSIEWDKKVTQKSLVTQKNLERQGETAIRHRALLIQQLEEKIEMIGEAIRGDGAEGEDGGSADDEVPRVDFNIVEELRIEVERLNRESEENETFIDQMDAVVELLETRVSVLDMVSSKAQKQIHRAEKDHKVFMTQLNREVETHDADVRSMESSVQAEITRLKQKLVSLEKEETNKQPADEPWWANLRRSVLQVSADRRASTAAPQNFSF